MSRRHVFSSLYDIASRELAAKTPDQNSLNCVQLTLNHVRSLKCNTKRHHKAPWADFQSDKFMTQVPTNWIYNMQDPVTYMQEWDLAMV